MSDMDFDLSKENIQPLRGGRNATQLGVALQAQISHEFQQELLQQKEEFENAIRTYEGEDPLENWYNYISWIEQSYPKHGYEGNLIALLEDCLKKFEDDKKYENDLRFCKIWIKFIDYHQNPLDLYHMLYAKGICRGCADMYKAWAYYHEVAGDYKSADLVFQRGKQELAQPYQELIAAHQNMIFAAGQQVIKGIDKNRLEEQRQALTSLRPHKHGKIGSIRTPSLSSSYTVGSKSQSKLNAAVPVYEDIAESVTGAEAAPLSIVNIARRDEGPKENSLKPGPWTTVQNSNRNTIVHRYPAFTVHEDSNDIHQRGLLLPPDYFPVTHEDLSTFKPSLIFPEPADPKMIPKYPKSLVYAEENTEYSLEEIKARQYLIRHPHSLIVAYNETQQAIQSILDENTAGAIHRSPHKFNHTQEQVNSNLFTHYHVEYPRTSEPVNNYEQQHTLYNHHEPFQIFEDTSKPEQQSDNLWPTPTAQQQASFLATSVHLPLTSPHSDSKANAIVPLTMDALWRSHDESQNESIVKNEISKFHIYEESGAAQFHPKGSAMKTPFKVLSDDDLAETGSRGGLDIAAVAQPLDGAIINLDDDTNSSYGDTVPCHNDLPNLNSTNTQIFNFNLNAMKVSTPVQDRQNATTSPVDVDSSKKQLFSDHKILSTILEETKNYGSSSGSSLGTQSRKINQLSLTQEQNSYSSNLAQNLKANAALRSSLLGEYMDCQSQQSSPITELPPPVPAVKPTNITPLSRAPSDPFQGSLIKMLLERINFPGQHTYGYRKMYVVPRLNIKKEEVTIADDRYYIEKILGKGTYGSVYKAMDCGTRNLVALKFQKPANKWEFYICRELQARLSDHPLRDKFMDVSIGYFNEHASILVSDFSANGSLLDVTNVIKQKSGRTMKEMLCVFFCIEMLEIVNAMHQAKIIHADVKPDNFLVQLVDNTVTLQLIDFGCSIDMAMFPADTTFYRRVRTEDFVCCEMQDGRPWSYHTDLFCVAATAHVLLFDKYIQMQKKDGHWSITQRFSRYMRVDCWNMFFSSLLNQQTGPAKVEPLVTMLRSVLDMNIDDYNTEMRFLVNLLKGR